MPYQPALSRCTHLAACTQVIAVGGHGSSASRIRASMAQTVARSFSTNPQESFMSGSNSVYVEEMYRAWLKDKGRWVHAGRASGLAVHACDPVV